MMPNPQLLLAPMQDVTHLPFWRVLARRGGPDIYVTEYFRVHANSRPEAHILRSIHEHGTGKPVIAQMIGNEPEPLVRTAKLRQEAPAAGIDLNLGCPAPTVCGKNSGGALLRCPERIREIAFALRDAVTGSLPLKTRIGFESPDEFDALLELFADLPLDGLAIHGRTVRERYQSEIHTEKIAQAVRALPFPVIANGSIVSKDAARSMLRKTDAAGLMIGRGAIRNPWIFDQIRHAQPGSPVFRPTLRDIHDDIAELYGEVAAFAGNYRELAHVQRMKKYTNYIANGISGGKLEAELRRARTEAEFEAICRAHLDSKAPLPETPSPDGTMFCGFEPLLANSI